MTTAIATKNETTYAEFSWQGVRKIAKEIGVPFYSDSTYGKTDGLGLHADRFDKTRIQVTGYYRAGDNEYTGRIIKNLDHQNFMLKLELWALKNNIQYVYEKRSEKDIFGKDHIRVIKAGA